MKNLGMIKFLSVHGAYLQAHYPDGELHASNQHQNEEETWFLFEIDKSAHVYALANWRNAKFLCKDGPGDNQHKVVANRPTVGGWEMWKLIAGEAHGAPGKVCFQAFDGTTMATNKPGDNYGNNGGEVYVSNGHPSQGDPGWAGWWHWSPVTTPPTPGSNLLNTVGGVFLGAANDLAQLTVESLVAALLGSV